MYKIDAHQHFWKYSKEDYAWINDEMAVIKRDFLVEDLEPILKENAYQGCVAVQARQSKEENEFLLNQSETNPIIKGIVGWVDLQNFNLNEDLDSYAKHEKMKGFRHIVQDEKDPNFLLRPDFIDGLKLLELYGYTYDLLIYESQMPVAIDFLNKLSGSQKIVLDHIGKPKIKEAPSTNWKAGIKALAKYPELYVKVSGMVTEASWKNWDEDSFKPYLDLIVSTFGVDRIMVGSDWPVCLLASDDYGSVMSIVENYFKSFSTEDKAKIFANNCIDFYAL